MFIKINGVESDIPEAISIQEMIAIKDLPEKTVIIELNGNIVKRENWSSIKLNQADQVEIIRFVGGG